MLIGKISHAMWKHLSEVFCKIEDIRLTMAKIHFSAVPCGNSLMLL